MSKLRLRDVFLRYPALDRIRRSVLVNICGHWHKPFTDSYHITRIFPESARPYVENTWGTEGEIKPAIFAIFHGRMVGLLGIKPRHKLTILISHSRDGEVIARAANVMGFSTARGSPAHGGTRGALEMVTACQSGQRLAFTVDGPRGPAYSVKEGIVRLAEITEMPIVPFVCQVRTHYVMKSWDSFMGPFFGTPSLYLFGEPIHVPRNLSDEERRQITKRLEEVMTNMRASARAFFDRRFEVPFPPWEGRTAKSAENAENAEKGRIRKENG